MNTILTDDDRIRIAHETESAEPGRDGYILPITFARAIEAAVLAKLCEQEPYGWVSMGQLRYTPPKADSDMYIPVYLRPMPAAPLPAVVQVPQERRTAFGMTHVKHLNEAVKWLDSRRERLHHEGCSVHEPSARCNCGLHKALTNIRSVVNELAAAPEAPAQGDREETRYWQTWGHEAPAHGEEHCRWCDACGEGVTTFCRGKTDACPMFKKAPAQTSVPAPWREAVKVMREQLMTALAYMHEVCPYYPGDHRARDNAIKVIEAAIALADSLEGGE